MPSVLYLLPHLPSDPHSYQGSCQSQEEQPMACYCGYLAVRPGDHPSQEPPPGPYPHLSLLPTIPPKSPSWLHVSPPDLYCECPPQILSSFQTHTVLSKKALTAHPPLPSTSRPPSCPHQCPRLTLMWPQSCKTHGPGTFISNHPPHGQPTVPQSSRAETWVFSFHSTSTFSDKEHFSSTVGSTSFSEHLKQVHL